MDSAFLSLMAEVEKKRAELSCTRSGAFFRGHSSGTFQLVPSFLRTETHQDTEHNLYHECFARANHLIARDATSWERLAFFQHYGIPTRLLDWTESLAVALFFAVKVKPARPHLWIMNAFRLNKSNGAAERPRILLAGLDPLRTITTASFVLKGVSSGPASYRSSFRFRGRRSVCGHRVGSSHSTRRPSGWTRCAPSTSVG